MSHVITAVEEITPAWLTSTLRRNGHLPSGIVQSVEITGVHDQQPHSVSYFLAAGYSPDAVASAPARLYFKVPRPQSDPEYVAMVGEREVSMYQALTPDQDKLPVIPCYDAAYDRARPAYHLLLADLSGTHDQPTSWNIPYRTVEQTVDCLARFHAYWWEHPRLGVLAELPTQERLNAEIDDLRQACRQFKNIAANRLSAEHRQIYDAVLSALPSLWAGRTRLGGQTMLHGDAHFWNFLYPLDSRRHRTCMLDWQSCHSGQGVKDLAFTVVLRWFRRTPAAERDLVARYHKVLLAGGVQGYSNEACWLDYRRAAAEHVLYPLRLWMSRVPEDFWGLFIDPALAGYRDLACTEILGG